MISEIRAKVTKFLQDQGLDVKIFGSYDLRDFDLKGGSPNLRTPATNVVINRARVGQVTASGYKTQYKYILTVTLFHVFFFPSNESPRAMSRRREGVEKILETVGDCLVGQDFDLELENPLLPLGFTNVTKNKWDACGYMVFSQDFWCSYIIEKLDPEPTAPAISQILASYFLEPEDVNAEPPQAQDLITA